MVSVVFSTVSSDLLCWYTFQHHLTELVIVIVIVAIIIIIFSLTLYAYNDAADYFLIFYTRSTGMYNDTNDQHRYADDDDYNRLMLIAVGVITNVTDD